ncbi:MAG: hypothetical protein M3436_16425 [Pseudomonadota bacterium]|nr:hypothetical protein [Pseudomonadota bacterium]
MLTPSLRDDRQPATFFFTAAPTGERGEIVITNPSSDRTRMKVFLADELMGTVTVSDFGREHRVTATRILDERLASGFDPGVATLETAITDPTFTLGRFGCAFLPIVAEESSCQNACKRIALTRQGFVASEELFLARGPRPWQMFVASLSVWAASDIDDWKDACVECCKKGQKTTTGCVLDPEGIAVRPVPVR